MEKFWLFLHLIGFVIGAGSVTTAYAREIYFKVFPHEAEKRGSLRVISPLLNLAFALIIISGWGLYLENPQKYNSSPIFLVKMGLLILLLINHIAVNAFIRNNKAAYKLLHYFAEYFSLLGWYLIIGISLFL